VSRRWRRGVVLALALVATLLLLRAVLGKALGPLVLRRAEQRFEGEFGPFEGWISEEAVGDEENAAVALRLAVAALRLSAEDHQRLRALRSTADPSNDLAGLRPLLSRNAEALAWLDQAAARPRSSFFPRAAMASDATLPIEELSALLRLERLSAALGLLALSEADERGLERALRQLAGLAVALRQQRLGVTSLLAGSAERAYYDLLWRRAALPGGGEVFAAADHLLQRIEAAPGYRAALASDAARAYVSLRAVGAAGEDMRVEEPTWGERFASLLSPWTPQHVEADFLYAYLDLALALDRPRVAWPARLKRLGPSRAVDRLLPWRGPRIVSSLLIPNLLDALQKEQRLDCERRLARLAVSLRLELARRGAYPGRLPEAAVVPLSAERPALVRRPDGGVDLSLPAAAASIRRDLAGLGLVEADPLGRQLALQAERMRWRLAPPN
jgi:hypothetical protein